MIVKEQKNGDSGVDSSGAEGQLLPYEIQNVCHLIAIKQYLNLSSDLQL